MTPNIRLSPTGQLHWLADDDSYPELARAFTRDWREGLFQLAAQRSAVGGSADLRYWQSIAEQWLTALCHVPPESVDWALPVASDEQLMQWQLSAPPLAGGEYLSDVCLRQIWESLTAWARVTAGDRAISEFIEQHAPKWRQVGRVCLHLAENRADPERPFAFMATYTSGLSSGSGGLRHLPLGKALEQYAGANNRAALLRLLSPLQQAAERCAWLDELVKSREIYQPTAWRAKQAYQLLNSVPQLEDSGLMVRLPDWWKARPRPKVQVSIDRPEAARVGLDAMLDFDVNVALGEEQLSADELKALLAQGNDGLVLFKGSWIEVDRQQLREALDHWRKVEKQARDGQITFIEGMRLLAGAPANLRDSELIHAEHEWLHVQAGERLQQLLGNLRDPARLSAVDDGKLLRARLRPYQRHGVAWMHLLTGLGLGACLADDMGLGKTLQVLALLVSLQKSGAAASPSLLVVPASLLSNWRSEAQRFAPSLKLQFLHPSECPKEELERIANAPQTALNSVDLVITPYSLLHRQSWLSSLDWQLVILDEAQAIKNPQTQQAKAVRQLRAQARIAMTGTPVENRLGDLWALFDFLNPGLLGSAAIFKSFVSRLERREPASYAPLRQLVAPYILRRMKTDRSIIGDLPDKTETQRWCSLSKPQARLYQQTVDQLQKALKTADGIARRGLVLQTLMRLKQICNHPSQLTGDGDFSATDSGKFQCLAELCEELAERQERVLIFTQFREIIDPLMRHLAGVFGREGLCLHGGTAVAGRKKIVDQFQAEDGPPFLVLSLKAGGTGLTLTAASQVIHFDRWWNPAVENQATDRAFRIGQKRHVLVHKFVTRGTVEERIDAMIADKRKLSDDLLGGEGEINLTELADEQLLQLVRLDVNQAMT